MLGRCVSGLVQSQRQLVSDLRIVGIRLGGCAIVGHRFFGIAGREFLVALRRFTGSERVMLNRLQLFLIKIELLLRQFGFTELAESRRVFDANFWFGSAQLQSLGELLASFGELLEFQQSDTEVIAGIVMVGIEPDCLFQMAATGGVLSALIFEDAAQIEKVEILGVGG